MPEAFRSAGLNARDLQPFEGAWRMTGQAFESPFGSTAPVSGYETFEWLAGEQFLVHHIDGRRGEEELASVEILGCDTDGEAFTAHIFYNDGSSSIWRLEGRDGEWTMAGEWLKDGQTFAVRCRIVFDDAAHRRGIWEYSSDRSTWRLFWQTKAERVW